MSGSLQDSGSRFKRIRIGSVMLAVGLIGLSYCAIAGGVLGAQQANQAPAGQWGQAPGRQSSEVPETADQQPGEAPTQASGQAAMSAEQIISILEKQPDLLDAIKSQIAAQKGENFGSVSDEAVYEAIRQDANLRDYATGELIRRGLGPDVTTQKATPANAPGARMAGQTAQQAPQKAPGTPQVAPYESPDNPQVQHRLSPYENLPSLTDLYAQFPAKNQNLRRFGSEAFVTGTGNANDLPMDLPAGPDYVLGPGDYLTVNIWGGQSSRLTEPIDRQGQIALPEAGTIMVDGLTIAQAQTAIQKALDTQFKGEHVEISLGKVRTVRIYVVGDVQRPGAYDVSSLSTPLSALYSAGGPTSRGSLRVLRQYRGNQLVRQVDLYDFFLRGVRSNDQRLLPGDTILVPPVGPQVFLRCQWSRIFKRVRSHEARVSPILT
jgi:protein involved in polysaccharide export with SLBB domain